MDIFKVILTAILSVAALFVITKIMGHKQVSQLDFFDYVSGITIGSIGAELATELESPEKPLIALAIYGLVSLTLSLVTSKVARSRKFINGTPTILYNIGKIYRENLKKAKLDLSEFMVMCREQGYFDLDEIQTAVFEYNGRLSILPRAAYRPTTPSDLKIPVKATHLGVEVVMDGRIMGGNLERAGRSASWLTDRLSQMGYPSVKGVMLAIYRPEEDKLRVYKKE